MFYRPNFCCHCGEKIDRPQWTPLTSRRFCEFCAIEQKLHDLIQRAAVIVALLFGAAGITAYLSAPVHDASASGSLRQAREIKTDGQRSIAATSYNNSANSNQPSPVIPADTAVNAHTTNLLQREIPQNSSTEPVYYCGAMTKRGTPCTRRVKTPGRCWQHIGQPDSDRSRK